MQTCIEHWNVFYLYDADRLTSFAARIEGSKLGVLLGEALGNGGGSSRSYSSVGSLDVADPALALLDAAGA